MKDAKFQFAGLFMVLSLFGHLAFSHVTTRLTCAEGGSTGGGGVDGVRNGGVNCASMVVDAGEDGSTSSFALFLGNIRSELSVIDQENLCVPALIVPLNQVGSDIANLGNALGIQLGVAWAQQANWIPWNGVAALSESIASLQIQLRTALDAVPAERRRNTIVNLYANRISDLIILSGEFFRLAESIEDDDYVCFGPTL